MIPVLRQAHTLLAEQLAQLRTLAERTRRDIESQSNLLRLAEREVDEVATQQRNAVARKLPGAPQLTRRVADMRARCTELGEALQGNQHALKQLEQLIRQIDMSSGTLAEQSGPSSDPWALALRAQIIQGREDERLRLAREVHDGPAQVLANALMLLETSYGLARQGNTERLTTMLDNARTSVREGMQDVRQFIADLRPGTLTEHGLSVAIADYVRQYANTYGTRIATDIEPLPRLPGDVETVLYRIMQEALQNAHKYARNAPMQLRLTASGGGIRLYIRDEGPGFDIHEVARRAGRSNWGLASMHERAELIGAKLMVASRPGYGTEISVVLSHELARHHSA